MERAAPVRSSHTSTAGLLAWPHPDGAGSLPARRSNQPTDRGVQEVVFMGQGVTEEGNGSSHFLDLSRPLLFVYCSRILQEGPWPPWRRLLLHHVSDLLPSSEPRKPSTSDFLPQKHLENVG